MRVRIASLFIALAWVGASPASASPGILDSRLTVFVGGGHAPGAPSIGPGLVSYAGGSFMTGTGSSLPVPLTFPSAAFRVDEFHRLATVVGGTVPIPTAPNSIFVLGQMVNQQTGPGSFGAGQGPGGGFGGVMDLGMDIAIQLGISPLPSFFGSIRLPIAAGSPGTETAMAGLLGNALTATAFGTGWTTGRVTYGGGASGTLATKGTVTGSRRVTQTSINSHPTRPGLGTFEYVSINLVTPILVRVSLEGEPGFQSHAGYASLRVRLRQLVPEPGLLVVLAAGSLAGVGWRRRRARGSR